MLLPRHGRHMLKFALMAAKKFLPTVCYEPHHPTPSFTFKFQSIIHVTSHNTITLVISLVSQRSLTPSIVGAKSRLPHGTQVPSTSSFPSHPSTGNSVTIIVTVVSVMVTLIIIVVVCIVLIAVLTCVKGSHRKQIDLQDNVCYTPSSRNDKRIIETQSEWVNISHWVHQLYWHIIYRYRPDSYSYTPTNIEHTDPPIDVDQNVAYHKHIELQDNVCYTPSFGKVHEETGDGSMWVNHITDRCTQILHYSTIFSLFMVHSYTYVPVDVQHTTPSQAQGLTMVENVAYGSTVTNRP